MDRPDESQEIQAQRKMYVIVREDLSPGLRAAQAGHAIAEMCLHQPEVAWAWHQEGNYLIVLGVPNEAELLEWFYKAKSWDVPHSMFREPDLANKATALTCLPSTELNGLFSSLMLAYTPQPRYTRLARYFGYFPD